MKGIAARMLKPRKTTESIQTQVSVAVYRWAKKMAKIQGLSVSSWLEEKLTRMKVQDDEERLRDKRMAEYTKMAKQTHRRSRSAPWVAVSRHRRRRPRKVRSKP